MSIIIYAYRLPSFIHTPAHAPAPFPLYNMYGERTSRARRRGLKLTSSDAKVHRVIRPLDTHHDSSQILLSTHRALAALSALAVSAATWRMAISTSRGALAIEFRILAFQLGR